MAQPQSNPKIEELRFRLKTDSKSRLFYPLAEELRKVSRFEESEQILRTGLEHHPTYLSAWVSLGRVLRDQHKNDGAAEALNKALQLDPGNVVAARLLADAYLDLGDKLEAIKKYKLVHALLPSDQDLPALIERLDRELNPIALAAEESPFAQESALPVPAEEPETPFAPPATPLEDTRPQARPEPSFAASLEVAHQATIEAPFADEATGDDEPMSAAHAESPFEQTAGYTAASLTVEKPMGFHVEEAPPAAEVPSVIEEEESPFAEPEPVADVFAPAEPVRATDDLTNTITMADLYARQGLTDDARQIYENILQRDPGNASVRAKLDALAPALSAAEGPPASPRAAKVAKLQNWLARVKNV
ncbi:MAG: tetratricopeptide repeat protein [Acidobacteriota bacterium]